MTVNLERKLINTEQTNVNLEGYTLAQVHERIVNLIKVYGADATIETYSPPYENRDYLYVYTKVPETDDQYNSRIADETKWEELALIRDRETFERLQKKFGMSDEK